MVTVQGKGLSRGVTAAALLALTTGGCGGDAHVYTEIPFETVGSGDFEYVSSLKFSGGQSAVGSAELLGVTLTLSRPSSVTDLTFLSTLEGQVITPTTTLTVATLDEFPRGARSLSLHLDYAGEIQPLFENSDTIRIGWTASYNPAFAAWPLDGIDVRLDVAIGSP
jgi:hypothetical protein